MPEVHPKQVNMGLVLAC